MNKKIFLLLSLSFFAIWMTSCSREKFADINTKPDGISTPDVRFLFSNLLLQSNPTENTYSEWFTDNDKFLLVWSQIVSGNQSEFPRLSESFVVNSPGDRTQAYYGVLSCSRRIWNVIDNELSTADKDAAQCLRAAVYPLLVYKAMKVTDIYGSMPYTEAGKAQYTSPMELTPEYDTQEKLFETWDQELKDAFNVLNNPPASQLLLGKNDWVYGGDWKKWAKFTNTMRLKIAARWYLQNPTKAKEIVAEVYGSGVYMSEASDDYFHFSGNTSCNFGGNFRWWGFGNQKLINFLRDNRDPRLRFFFEKNRYSSSVIKQFLAEGKPLPEVMQPYIQVSEDGKDFEWINDGEPWGRYHGIPCVIGAELPQAEQDYYMANAQFQLQATENITFSPWSYTSTHFIQPRQGSGFTTYPDITIGNDGKGTLPPNITTISNYYYKGRLVTAAESYYIFAEFKVLGAAIDANANDLFHKAVELSVTSHDMTASDHNVAWYRTSGADTKSVLVNLKDGEIASLLTQPAYNLTGDPLLDLEKIYVNMMVHYNQTPNDIFVTARRGGVPKIGSTIGFAYTPFSALSNFVVPRRLDINAPTDDNINKLNIQKAIADQGFEFNIPANTQKLHDQRIWYDKPAPDWGQGPIIK